MQKTKLLILITLLFINLNLITSQENTAVESEDNIILDETAGSNPEAENNAENQNLRLFTFWDFLRMVLILSFVIGLIYLLYYFLKKLSLPETDQSDLIKIHTSKGLSSGRSLHIVQIGNKMYLIGEAEGAISKISEIDDKETFDTILLNSTHNKEKPVTPFRNLLNSIYLKKNDAKVNETGLKRSLGFLKKQKERLKKL